VVDHLDEGRARRCGEVHRRIGDPGGGEGSPRRRGRGLVGRVEGPPERIPVQRQPHGDGAGDLDRGAADLPVALRVVEVADREQRPRHGDGQQQAAARHELPDVEIAAELARRDRPQAVGRLGREGRLGQRVGDGAAGGRDRLLPFADRRQQLVRRRDADDSRERVLGHGDAG
jgi:hypothetical protein